MGLDNKAPAGFKRGWRGGMPPEEFSAGQDPLSRKWFVEQHRPCINGLSAWVIVADCGVPEPGDEMHGLDRERMARDLAAAMNARLFKEPGNG